MRDRIVFLDFDGVLNSRPYLDRIEGELSDADDRTRSPKLLDPQAIALLNDLLARTDARVVVSSIWRMGRTVEDLQRVLEQRGFVGVIIGKTPDGMVASTHASHIEAWLAENGARNSSFVILDDDPEMGFLAERHVAVDADTGLTSDACDRAAALLLG